MDLIEISLPISIISAIPSRISVNFSLPVSFEVSSSVFRYDTASVTVVCDNVALVVFDCLPGSNNHPDREEFTFLLRFAS